MSHAPAHKDHAINCREFNKDQARVSWHDKALYFVREKRDRASRTVPEWEALRDAASQIKQHTLYKMDEYLLEFEKNARANGAVVHFAKDAQEHNEIVYKILKDNNVEKLVKSKSMLTEECHMNPYLEERGIDVVDTDLGERIVQLNQEPPSHIVLPAIHLKKEDVSEIFNEHLGTEKGNADPYYLTESARHHLREKFLAADAGLTGVNMAVAETGVIVVNTNEGNADLGMALPPIHIACMGVDKLIPKMQDLSVFTRLLARSATGQPVTTYTSHVKKPLEGGQLHIVVVDNGRTDLRAHKSYSHTMQCIRCGACLNTCPVYRRSGGHSYGSTIPGPIGSVFEPARDLKTHHDLPLASTLCGSCGNVCPAKIPIPEMLLELRQDSYEKDLLPAGKKIALKAAGVWLRNPWAFDTGMKIARFMLRNLPKSWINNKFNIWTKQRDMSPAPEKSFKEMMKERKGH